jgi:hypothetical protein
LSATVPAPAHPHAPIFQRLEDVVREEIAALQRHDLSRLAEFSERKARGLIELSRAIKAAPEATDTPETRARLADLRPLLADGQRLLRLHLEAAGEVARLLAETLSGAESDGTYSPGRIGGRGAQ